MAPDEDSTAVAVEDPKPPVPAPVEQEPEAVPSPAEEEAEESVATEGEEEGEDTPEARRAAILERIADLEETDPELAQSLRDRFAQEAETYTEAELQQVAQERVQQRQAWVQQQGATFMRQFGPQAAQAVTAGLLDIRAKDIADKAAKLKADPDAPLPALDPTADAGIIAQYVQRSAQEAYGLGANAAKAAILDVVDLHPATRYLNDEERGYISQALDAPDIMAGLRVIYWATLNAALRGAPEHVTQQAKAEAEKNAKTAEKYADLLDKLPGKNGQRPGKARGGGPAGSQPKSEAEARDWHATGRWNTPDDPQGNRKMREFLAGQRS